jgi:hypothetical protein
MITQEGSARAHIHIQDGGSSREVALIIEKASLAMDSNRFRITHSQEPDSGAANAVNKGISKVSAHMVTWLGADDILLPGCFEMVRTLVQEQPTVEWVTGLRKVILANGIPIPTYGPVEFESFPLGFSKLALAIGEHANGPNHGFVQQEGTFLSSVLWHKLGGLDESLRLAFDFDLWCRGAAQAELVQINAPLAAFRIRPGQASEDRASYFREVSSVRQQMRPARAPLGPKTSKTVSIVAYFDKASSTWRLVRRRFSLRHQSKTRTNSAFINKAVNHTVLFLTVIALFSKTTRRLINHLRRLKS